MAHKRHPPDACQLNKPMSETYEYAIWKIDVSKRCVHRQPPLCSHPSVPITCPLAVSVPGHPDAERRIFAAVGPFHSASVTAAITELSNDKVSYYPAPASAADATCGRGTSLPRRSHDCLGGDMKNGPYNSPAHSHTSSIRTPHFAGNSVVLLRRKRGASSFLLNVTFVLVNQRLVPLKKTSTTLVPRMLRGSRGLCNDTKK